MWEDKIKLKNDSQIKIADDKFSRRELAKKYAKFIRDLDGHHVVALDAPWGSGKSTLLEFMCKNFEEFRNKDVFVKYNAWENDYTEEPLISLMSDVFAEFKDKKYIGIDKMKNQISSIVKVGKKSITALLKGGTRIALGEGGSNDAIEAVKEASKIFVDDNVDNLFKDIDKSKKSRKEFKEELRKYTNSILEEKGKDKLIIIIDELDRCRPTFAIELLENIKHLFDIEKIVFLIAVDTNQLTESIKSVYGNGFDAQTYLHRFFDIELWLNNKDLQKHFVEQIMNKFPEEFKVPYFKSNISLITISKNIFEYFNLTIRDINKIINEYYVLYHLKLATFKNMDIYLYILILKNKSKKSFDIINNLGSIAFNRDNLSNNLNNDKIFLFLMENIFHEIPNNEIIFRENTYDILKEISKSSE